METITPPETRGRSRSKTPFLRSSCDREACTQLGEGHVHERKLKKSPQVQTIIEESFEQNIPSNRKLHSAQTKSSKIVTSDYSSDDLSPETARQKSNMKTVTITTTTETITKGGQQSSSFKNSSSSINASKLMSSSSDKFKETSQNEINSAFEASQMQTSTPIGNSKKLQFATNGKAGEHISYNEYKAAGEYWKKYPKTDYTYSRLSPHRRELAPGIIAMPNMSRKSLEQHDQRINVMIQQNPTQESYIRQRYETTRHTSSGGSTRLLKRDMQYDSQDEVDLTEFESFKQSRRYLQNKGAIMNRESIITRIITTIVTLFSRMTSVFRREDENLYYTKIQENRGFFNRMTSAISSVILSIFRPLYMLISSILYLDTWLLRSSSADSRGKKRFLLILLLLLPLLLLAAWCFMEEQERNATILRVQSIIPISLIGFPSILPANWRDIFKLDFQSLTAPILSLSSSSLPSSSQHSYESITNNFQKSLSSDEFNSLVNHINNYVQKLVDDKLVDEREKHVASESKISKEMSILIANTVHENIIAATTQAASSVQPYELSDTDISRIVELVKLQLSSMDSTEQSFTLSQENLEAISKLIKHNIEVNNQNFNIIERIDIDEVLFRILKSPKLDEYVMQKIFDASERDLLERQQLVIDGLENDIQLMKSQLAGSVIENQALHNSIDALKANQATILKQFDSFQADTDGRFTSLLTDIDAKIATLDSKQFALINKQIKLALVDILGYKNGKNVEEIDLQNWVRNMFVAKEFLEERLSAVSEQTHQQFRDELDRSGMLLMKEISEKMKIEILKMIELKEIEKSAGRHGGAATGLTEQEIKMIVRDALAVYDADKTGLVDYALESAGGQVLSTRCTENYHTKSAQLSIFGIPLWYPSNTPRIAISPAVQPGECWAFQGFPGFLVLKLNSMVMVTGFTIEHVPKSLTPNGKIDSAPKNFSVWGLINENDQEPTLFGEYEYVDDSVALQYFPVQNREVKTPFDIVELRIESNHGNRGYTCLYRFRVHGAPVQ